MTKRKIIFHDVALLIIMVVEMLITRLFQSEIYPAFNTYANSDC